MESVRLSKRGRRFRIVETVTGIIAKDSITKKSFDKGGYYTQEKAIRRLRVINQRLRDGKISLHWGSTK